MICGGTVLGSFGYFATLLMCLYFLGIKAHAFQTVKVSTYCTKCRLHHGLSALQATSLGQEIETNKSFRLSKNQERSIQTDAPAVMLRSPPGTGKTYALACRIAHLIRSGSCRPEEMVVLSFTNRDAHALKEQALNLLFAGAEKTISTSTGSVTKENVSVRLWSGTVHAFASSIIRSRNRSRRRLRVLTSKEMRHRVDKSLCIILDERSYRPQGIHQGSESLKSIRMLYRDALSDLKQSRGMVLHQICRCIELWKEAGLLLPPSVLCIPVPSCRHSQTIADNCLELSMRLGITPNVARLALHVVPEYQSLHSLHTTADPSDLASIAYYLLLSQPRSLRTIREKLSHIVLDEYQDVSVTQHALIRLVIRGFASNSGKQLVTLPSKPKSDVPPVLETGRLHISRSAKHLSFNVPKLFCSGDENQSIYGWRGACPSLSVEGFLEDYPQGIVVPLETCFRLSRSTWKAASTLIGDEDATGENPARDSSKKISCSDQDDGLPMMFSQRDPELSTSIRIQGVWDAREEAKYIAWTIRKRSKTRLKRLTNARRGAGFDPDILVDVNDPTDVAVIVRAASHFVLFEEALASAGIPFVSCRSDEDITGNRMAKADSNIKLMNMKPVVLMTMHRSKGEEFDDIYLPNWVEGIFPHPTSVSNNRVDEERRLAYVAMTRARHHITITHPFVRQVLYHDLNRSEKLVTTQVRPSRFLYELVPKATDFVGDIIDNSEQSDSRDAPNVPSVVWHRGKGIKEYVAGSAVPEYFAKSYAVPPKFVPAEPLQSKEESNHRSPLKRSFRNNQSDTDAEKADGEIKELIINAFAAIRNRKRGSRGKFRFIFRALLRDRFQLERGAAKVLPRDHSAMSANDISVDALLKSGPQAHTKRALSQCTAIQLGLYLWYLLCEAAKQ